MIDGEGTPFEIALELPELIDGPVSLPSGEILAIGDKIQHEECGIGLVIRFATYHDSMGLLVCAEFPNDRHEMLGVNFVRKV